MKIILKFLVCSTLICNFLFSNTLTIAGELIAPTRSLKDQNEQMGRLSVFSEPPGLEVTLDGIKIGKTPVFSQAVEPGPHVLQIKDSDTEIIVKSGKPIQFSWNKGTFIEIPIERKETRQQPKPDYMQKPKKKNSEQPAEKKLELHPLYWPLNPRGPIY